MPVLVSLLRGVNVGGHNKIRTKALENIYESLGLRDVTVYLQSGNVVFTTRARDLPGLAVRIESAIENEAGFKPRVILRTAAELRDVVSRNPFAARNSIEPSKLAVLFLTEDPGEPVRDAIRRLRTEPEEVVVHSRELFVYFPGGMGRSKLPQILGKTLIVPATGRNWNTVTKLASIADALEQKSG